MDGYVALSGSYACGHIKKSAMVRSDHLLDWARGFGGFGGHGTVATVEEAKPAMAKAFRDSLARVGLAEIQGPGRPSARARRPKATLGSRAPRYRIWIIRS
jgi:hypothetical protein